MKKIFGFITLFLALAVSPVFAQTTTVVTAPAVSAPSFEVFAGTQYATNSGFNFAGWEVAPTYKFNPNSKVNFGITVDASGVYGSKINTFNVYGGPVVTFKLGAFQPFVHALPGVVNVLGYQSGSTFGLKAGGGVDIVLSNHFAIRPVQVDYAFNNFSNIRAVNNGFNYSGGLVVRF